VVFLVGNLPFSEKRYVYTLEEAKNPGVPKAASPSYPAIKRVGPNTQAVIPPRNTRKKKTGLPPEAAHQQPFLPSERGNTRKGLAQEKKKPKKRAIHINSGRGRLTLLQKSASTGLQKGEP